MPYKNPEDAKARHRRHYLANKVRYLETAKAWSLAHPKPKKPPKTPEELAMSKYTSKASKARRLRRVKAERFNLIKELKETNPCEDCGYLWPAVVMEFDHVRGHKSFTISGSYKKSLQTICTEIAKCDLVCANCHRLRHLARKSSPANI